MFTSSNCRMRKKHDAMHCRPGMVSHSCADVPTSWKHCWAIFKCSRDPVAWPIVAWTTPLMMYSCGVVGSRSRTSSYASLTASWRRW